MWWSGTAHLVLSCYQVTVLSVCGISRYVTLVSCDNWGLSIPLQGLLNWLTTPARPWSISHDSLCDSCLLLPVTCPHLPSPSLGPLNECSVEVGQLFGCTATPWCCYCLAARKGSFSLLNIHYELVVDSLTTDWKNYCWSLLINWWRHCIGYPCLPAAKWFSQM